MAARRQFVIRGDKQLTRMLNALGKRARPVVSKALRKAAKLVLEEAKNIVPVQSGRFKHSLTVRALKRSRRGFGFRVTQKELKDGKVFYGSFLELGYRPGKRSRGNARRKIPGRWLLRKAGEKRESEAIGLYVSEVRRLVEEAK